MDQPALNTLARELAERERLREFVAAPAAARVSEPLVPLFLAAVFLERGGPLVIVFPDDAEARDAAEPLRLARSALGERARAAAAPRRRARPRARAPRGRRARLRLGDRRGRGRAAEGDEAGDHPTSRGRLAGKR